MELATGFLDHCRDLQQSAHDHEQNGHFVTLSTLHAAKGLAFDTIVFAGFDSERLPHHRKVSEAKNRKTAIAADRRLAYVGMTRPRSELHPSVPPKIGQGGNQKPVKQSPLVNDIAEHTIECRLFEKATSGRDVPTGGQRSARPRRAARNRGANTHPRQSRTARTHHRRSPTRGRARSPPWSCGACAPRRVCARTATKPRKGRGLRYQATMIRQSHVRMSAIFRYWWLRTELCPCLVNHFISIGYKEYRFRRSQFQSQF